MSGSHSPSVGLMGSTSGTGYIYFELLNEYIIIIIYIYIYIYIYKEDCLSVSVSVCLSVCLSQCIRTVFNIQS